MKQELTAIDGTKKRQRTVFTSMPEIAHLWANKLQNEARMAGCGNFYFNGNTIYSYGAHFPIAKHCEDKVLFTLCTYSNTTAKHINYVRSACSHLDKLYCYYLPYGKNDTFEHERNIKIWVNNIKSEIEKLKSARKPELYISAIFSYIRQLKEYATFFNFKLSKEVKDIISIENKEGFIALWNKDNENRLAEVKRIQTIGKKLYLRSIEAWRNYSTKEFREGLNDKQVNLLSAYRKTIDTNFTILRFNSVEIETSKDVKIPLDVAKRFYTWFKSIKENGCIECNKEILGYQVTSANVNGLVVGCHNISIDEINLIANKLNW